MRRIAATALLLFLAPGVAWAGGLTEFGLPGPGVSADEYGQRPSYRETYNDYPPPQHNILGQPEPAPSPYDRPSYREAYDDFPPTAGRYGGGFVEYVITGGHPGAPPAPAYAAPAPAYAAPSYAAPYPPAAPAYAATTSSARAVRLPHSGLPEYQPDQPPAYYLGPQSMAAPATSSPLAMVAPAAYETALSIDPIYQRQQVAYAGRERAGTIVIDTPNKFLYLVEPRGVALRYGIGVGRPGFAWAGVKTISRKAEWPDWTPPSEMVARRPDLPRHMAGGPANPLGARALYLGSSLYRIHGTNEPYTIGTNVSSGCIRMMNQDVIDLYGRVGVGTRVVVL
jgi:lipoprotein-anchoring transpeptidase ErfK/SrfK